MRRGRESVVMCVRTGIARRSFCLAQDLSVPPVSHDTVATMPFKMPARVENEKRAITDVASAQQQTSLKKPKLPPNDSALVALESVAKKPAARRLPATAPLNICVPLACVARMKKTHGRVRTNSKHARCTK